MRAVLASSLLGGHVAGFFGRMVENGGAPVSILVVDVDAPAVDRRIDWLKNAGYTVSGATTFHDAIQMLENRPGLLIVSFRLGAFNGLHLVLRSRADNPWLAAIVLGKTVQDGSDEARAAGAVFGLQPHTAEELLALVSTALTGTPT